MGIMRDGNYDPQSGEEMINWAKRAEQYTQERCLNQQIGAKEARVKHMHADKGKRQEDSQKCMN